MDEAMCGGCVERGRGGAWRSGVVVKRNKGDTDSHIPEQREGSDTGKGRGSKAKVVVF